MVTFRVNIQQNMDAADVVRNIAQQISGIGEDVFQQVTVHSAELTGETKTNFDLKRADYDKAQQALSETTGFTSNTLKTTAADYFDNDQNAARQWS
jgi:uncharacterized protein YukE